MADTIRFEWQFDPPDYFEAAFTGEFEACKFEIRDGNVVGHLDALEYDRDPTIRQRLLSYITSLFEGIRLQSHKRFEIRGGGLYRVHPDGRTDVTVFPEPAGFVMMAGNLDLKVTNAEGTVLRDTKQARIDEKRAFALLVASKRGKDKVLDYLLSSYASAVEDPANELVHLFEIREALSGNFGGEPEARKVLSVSANDWSTLGRLANEEPLRQGRHRGRHPAQLRDASKDELETARAVARRLITAYLKKLA